MNYIDKKAIINQPSIIKNNVYIGSHSIIGPYVEIDDDTWIDSHVTVKGNTIIGKKNKIYKFTSIGDEPQYIRSYNKNNKLIIGNNNIIREKTSIHKSASSKITNRTIIGNNNYFMVNSHIAHDCFIGNNIIFSNGVSLAGHVKIHDYAHLSGLVGVHQYVHLGAYSFAGGGSIICKDVLPYTLVAGYPAKVKKINIIGLKRLNFTEESIKYLKKIYRLIFKSNLTVKQILLYLELEEEFINERNVIIKFLRSSRRGIVR